MTEVKGISAFLKYLYRREANLLKQVEHLIRSIRLADLKRRLGLIRMNAEARLQVPEVRARLISAVDSSFANVLHRYAIINPEETESIHRIRIAFKSFRHAVEVIHPLLVRYPREQLKAMNNFQGLMGDIQDIEVLQELLKAFRKKHPELDISPSMALVDERHQLLVDTFLAKMDTLNVFWRTTPRQPYPWNQARPESPAGKGQE